MGNDGHSEALAAAVRPAVEGDIMTSRTIQADDWPVQAPAPVEPEVIESAPADQDPEQGAPQVTATLVNSPPGGDEALPPPPPPPPPPEDDKCGSENPFEARQSTFDSTSTTSRGVNGGADAPLKQLEFIKSIPFNMSSLKKHESNDAEANPQTSSRLSMANIDNHLLVQIQARIRGRSVRKEYSRARSDREILLPRAELRRRLMEYPDSRTAKIYMCFYIFYVALALSAYFVALTPTQEYEGGGKIRSFLVNDQSTATYDLVTPALFWDWFDTGVLGNLQRYQVTDQSTVYANHLGYASDVSMNTITIALERRPQTSCTEVYSQRGAWNLHDSGYCLQDGDETGTYLGDSTSSPTHTTTMEAFYNDYANQQSWVQSYIASNATLCPQFDWSARDSTNFQLMNKEGAYVAKFQLDASENPGSTNHLLVSAMLNRCNFIDRQVKAIQVELYLMTGNSRPLITFIHFHWDVSMTGQIDYSDSVVTLDIESGNASNVAAKVLFGFLMAAAFLNIVAMMVNFAYNLLLRSSSLSMIWEYLRDFDVWLGVILYLTALASGIAFYKQQADIETMNSTSDFGSEEFYTSWIDLMDSTVWRRHCAAINVMLIFVRLLAYYRHRGMLSMVWKVTIVVTVPIIHFLISFTAVSWAFAMAAYFIWGNSTYEFSSLDRCWHSMVDQLTGSFNYAVIERPSPLVGPLFYLAYFMIVVTIGTNFLIAIVLEGYTEVATNHNVNLPLWTELANDIAAASNATFDALFIRRSVGTDHLAFLVRVDTYIESRTHVNLFHLKRMAQEDLSHECKDCIYGVMKDSGCDDTELWRAHSEPYHRLRLGWLDARYGKVKSRLVFFTPQFLRKYTLLGVHMVDFARHRLVHVCCTTPRPLRKIKRRFKAFIPRRSNKQATVLPIV